MTISPIELVTRLSGSYTSSQPPIRKAGRNLAVGSIRTAQCRRTARTASSSSSRYLATSLLARPGSAPDCRPVVTGCSGQRLEEVRQGGRGIADGLPRHAHERRRLLRRLDDVEDHEGDRQPGENLLH